MSQDDKKLETDDAKNAPGDDALEDVTEGIDALDEESPFDEGSAHFPGSAWMAPAWAGNTRIVYARPAAAEAEPPPSRVRVLESSDAVLPGDAVFRSQRRAGLAIVDLAASEERTLVDDGRPLRRFDVAPDGRHAIVEVGENGGGSLLFSLDEVEAEPRTSRPGQRLGWLADGRLHWRAQGRLLATRAHEFGVTAVTLLDPLEPAPGPLRGREGYREPVHEIAGRHRSV